MRDNAENKTHSVEDQVRNALASRLYCRPEMVTADADFTNDLGADPMDRVEFIMWLEERFGITIPETDADRLTTLARTMAYLTGLGVA